jgi:hypothetical protein
VYTPTVMLRNLAPQEMTPDLQRKADEQLGQAYAAMAGRGHRVAARARTVAALAARVRGLAGGLSKPGRTCEPGL